VGNHVIELVLPFLTFLPWRLAGMLNGLGQIFFQAYLKQNAISRMIKTISGRQECCAKHSKSSKRCGEQKKVQGSLLIYRLIWFLYRICAKMADKSYRNP